MDAKRFLQSVLPSVGSYCAVSMAGGTEQRYPNHFFFNKFSEIDDLIDPELRRKRDLYVALASFSADERKAHHAVALRTFFLDMDVGKGKAYSSVDEALEALDAFCDDTGMPPATRVCSGYGVHVYWTLTDDVHAEDWLPIALRLKALCEQQGLGADPAVTADLARILRIPGTKNFKRETPADVRLLRLAQSAELGEIVDVLDRLGIATPEVRVPAPAERTPLSALTQSLMGNRVARFSTIARKSLSGKGCNALKFIIMKQEQTPEPLWFSGLSIAQHCEDGAVAIHKISSRHPGYSPEKTMAKAQGAAHPHTCDTFRQRAPELCAGCTLRIKSPIVLGHSIAEDSTDGVIVDEVEVICEGDITPENLQSLKKTTPTIFKPPFPYLRGKNGGIYRREQDDDGNNIEELVYEYDFYPTLRLMDPNDGEVVVFRLSMPHDGEREFYIPLADIGATDKFRAVTGRNGIAAGPAQQKALMSYAIRFTKELQAQMQAREARLQFGWTPKRDGFAAGNRLYMAKKTVHNPVSSATADIIHWITPVGELADWRRAINALAAPGMEPLQFAALCGFGSPLMPYSGVAGVTVNLMSNESGTGKTTACQIANSVFGHPEHTMIIERDTQNAREHKMGVMNNLVTVADEMTNVHPLDLSDMIYAATQGRGKDRMEGTTNRLRANSTRWQLILLTNSNSSMAAKLAATKSRADGELMRLIELQVNHVVVENGDAIFQKIRHNYGVAGPIYAQWLVQNANTLQQRIDAEKERLWKMTGKDTRERFIIGTLATVLTGASIARALELHDLNIEALREWAVRYIASQRESVALNITSSDTMIGEYINAHHADIVGVDTKVVNAITGTNVYRIPRSGAIARLELGDSSAGNKSKLYISRKHFRDYCVERQYTMEAMLATCADPNEPFYYVGPAKKRLMSGTGITAPAVDVLYFICSEDEADALRGSLSDAELES